MGGEGGSGTGSAHRCRTCCKRFATPPPPKLVSPTWRAWVRPPVSSQRQQRARTNAHAQTARVNCSVFKFSNNIHLLEDPFAAQSAARQSTATHRPPLDATRCDAQWVLAPRLGLALRPRRPPNGPRPPDGPRGAPGAPSDDVRASQQVRSASCGAVPKALASKIAGTCVFELPVVRAPPRGSPGGGSAHSAPDRRGQPRVTHSAGSLAFWAGNWAGNWAGDSGGESRVTGHAAVGRETGAPQAAPQAGDWVRTQPCSSATSATPCSGAARRGAAFMGARNASCPARPGLRPPPRLAAAGVGAGDGGWGWGWGRPAAGQN